MSDVVLFQWLRARDTDTENGGAEAGLAIPAPLPRERPQVSFDPCATHS